MEIDDAVLSDIRAAREILDPCVPELVEELGGWLRQRPEPRHLFEAEAALLERARGEQTAYWREFLAAERDDAYVERRRATGHERAGLDLTLQAFLETIDFCHRWLLSKIEAHRDLCEQKPSMRESLRRLIRFDAAAIASGYALRAAELLQEQRESFRQFAAVTEALCKDWVGDDRADTAELAEGWPQRLTEGWRKDVGDAVPIDQPRPADREAVDELGDSLQAITQMVREAAEQGDELPRKRLEPLLTTSQLHAEELTSRQQRLAEHNDQLERLAQSLAGQKDELLGTEQKLRRKASELERMSHRKSEFLANMSHELRTPLNATMVLAKVLAKNEEGTLTPRQMAYARSIHAAGEDLLALINDILDLSKIEAGIVELNIEPVPIESLVFELGYRFRPLAEEQGLEMGASVESSLPETIETDRQRLQQLLTNLLSNALKFTTNGSVRLVATSRGPDRVAFSVEDTGAGIDASHHESIFTPFQQVGSGDTRGTGLGLSIARELVEFLGGELELRSAPGHGSVFTVVLPREYVCPPELERARVTRSSAPPPRSDREEPQRLPSPARVPPSTLYEGAPEDQSCRILLVEDDVRSVFALTSLLEPMGVQLEIARNGQEALSRLDQGPPFDVVLMDISMPEMDGLTAIRAVREGDGQPEVPIVALTANALASDRDHCIAAGATAYLSKPVDVGELMTVMRRAVMQ